MHRAAIMVHYEEVTKMEQRALMDVGVEAAHITSSSRASKMLPTKWLRCSNMAPTVRREQFASTQNVKKLRSAAHVYYQKSFSKR